MTYAITGITGKVGGAMASSLLGKAAGVAVLRDAPPRYCLEDRGCEIALADMNDAAALHRGFKGPTAFSFYFHRFSIPSGFSEASAISLVLRYALLAAQRPKSSVFYNRSQATRPNLLTSSASWRVAPRVCPCPSRSGGRRVHGEL